MSSFKQILQNAMNYDLHIIEIRVLFSNSFWAGEGLNKVQEFIIVGKTKTILLFLRVIQGNRAFRLVLVDPTGWKVKQNADMTYIHQIMHKKHIKDYFPIRRHMKRITRGPHISNIQCVDTNSIILLRL